MGTKLFVNLPVKDLTKTEEFFTKLGYKFDPRFSDDNAKCLIISEDNYAMLLTETFFKVFTKREITDTSGSTEVILTLTVDTRKDVDVMLDKVIKAGGTEVDKPEGQEQNEEWMYSRSFMDPDGHQWEFFYMDTAKIPSHEHAEARSEK